MKKLFISFVLLLVIASLIPNSVGFARQNQDAPVVLDLQQAGTDFTLAQLNEEERRLFGPYATESVLFGLPANWRLTADAQLELDYSVTIQSSDTANNAQFFGGSLTVFMNDDIISVIPLDLSGRFTQTIGIPIAAFETARRDGRQEMTIVLSSGQSCLFDARVDVVIHSNSRFVIPHDVTVPDTDLTKFPRPLYQDTIFTDNVLVVIPDQPTSAELQAALTVSAGLEARTNNGLIATVVTHNNLNEDLLASAHIVMIGNASSLPTLYQLATPLNLVDGAYSDANDAGVLQMIPSPWSSERVVLIVSGNDDQATVNAAQALSTGVIRPAGTPNVALISDVNNQVYIEQSAVNQTLDSLGYESTTFEGRGENTETFQFFIPTGQTVTNEAYFEASISNSTLLNYARSGVFVLINDKPIGSIRLSDETANKANNRIQIAIPPTAVRSGLNNLDVVVALQPLDECSDPNQAGLFVTLWADSRMYLPLTPVAVDTVEVPDLSTYPIPFIQSPDLGKVAFVLQRDNPEAWSSAIKIAGYLGAQSDGVIFTPAVFYADETATADLTNYNIMAVGMPSKMEFIGAINDKLPVPFAPGSDIASEESLQVVYEIDPQQPAGYLQLATSPYNLANLVVGVFGNSPQGISWAADTLLSEIGRQALLGNFAVIRGSQVVSVDTRFVQLEVPVPAQEQIPTPETAGQPSLLPTASTSTTSWIPIALGISFLMMILVIVMAVISGRRKSE
ncbi:MAG: cellulose biosynthesis cyclic di-GMP-binding regulatory protein BcsB [Anaerolineae bacterium]|nr:cellulose biosynthesis cyclic di-GMP-binding regulatory protein BcsB [Anaerolineae bacterium]